ncbi:phosphoribosylformylglycinamidine cyclo-ligase [Prochlorococcus sp. MIT 1307]|uniref:phosphoribosylformylglycinamidine cyclo-ligase n=1 Tax=Prochlorococcus sp. MIT 1307 TaxID=3096219 RepID=UPI002A75534D|nr:phosphoribosylformylglycinamidine cyclo-ligase [Prochlorococcus sp. MIT 1307]
MDYKTAGVDVEAGRAFVDRIRSSVEATHLPGVLGGLGGFGGVMRLPSGLSSPLLVAGADGVGTKLELAQDYQAHFGVGIDLVAMCVNDVITSGAQPLFFLDYIATGVLTPEAMAEVVEGIAKGCQLSGCALLGGETAEMPGFYAKGRYDLAGFCVAVVEEADLIDGTEIKSGDQIVGVSSNGVHSNGFSLVRKVLNDCPIHDKGDLISDGLPVIDALLRPTSLYVQLVKALLGEGIPIRAMAHITGGGLPENLPRCLPKGLQASIDITTWERPEVFKWLQNVGNIPEIDLWNTFNLGVGFCLVVPSEDAQATVDICCDNGFGAWIMGRVQDSITSNSKGLLGLPF